MKIARLAEAGRVGVKTVRYDQRSGLLSEPERPGGGGFRSYEEGDVRTLGAVNAIASAGKLAVIAPGHASPAPTSQSVSLL